MIKSYIPSTFDQFNLLYLCGHLKPTTQLSLPKSPLINVRVISYVTLYFRVSMASWTECSIDAIRNKHAIQYLDCA